MPRTYGNFDAANLAARELPVANVIINGTYNNTIRKSELGIAIQMRTIKPTTVPVRVWFVNRATEGSSDKRQANKPSIKPARQRKSGYIVGP